MEKTNSDIKSLVERARLSTATQNQIESMRQPILDDVHKRIADYRRRSNSRMWYWWVSAAASVAAIIVFTFIIFSDPWTRTKAEPVEYVASATGKTTITLPDNSIVELNAGSTLIYDKIAFGKNNREVNLNGEAFFDVEKNPDVPFIVHNNDVAVQVLGTRFNVEGYETDASVKVTLQSGRVSMSVSNNDSKLVLEPGQQGIYNKVEDNFSCRYVNVDEVTAWLDGGIYFDDMTLEQICERLSRNYNVLITIESDILRQSRYTGAFDAGDDAESILSVLALMDDRIEYQITDNSIRIYTGK